jgi:hypothetical protein
MEEVAAEQEIPDRYDYDDYPDDEPDGPDTQKLLLILWPWFRLWAKLKAPLKEIDYYDMEQAARDRLWRVYEDFK